MTERIKYLENLLPCEEQKLIEKYNSSFETATYMGNGIYQWSGIYSKDTRELWLMGLLEREEIEYKNV